MNFIAFIYKDTDNNYTGVIPDVNFVSSFGKTKDECKKKLNEALGLMLEDIEPTTIHTAAYFTKDVLKEMDIPLNSDFVNMTFRKKTTERVTITMRVTNKNIIDDYVKTHNLSRSAFLEQSALAVATA